LEGGENMNITKLALIVGIVVAGLGLLGLISGDGKIADSMNIDLMLDMARVGLGAILIFASTKSVEISRTAFAIFGVAYLGMFVLGLLSPTLFGMLPSGLGLIDQVLHLGGGALGVYVMMMGSKKIAHA